MQFCFICMFCRTVLSTLGCSYRQNVSQWHFKVPHVAANGAEVPAVLVTDGTRDGTERKIGSNVFIFLEFQAIFEVEPTGNEKKVEMLLCFMLQAS